MNKMDIFQCMGKLFCVEFQWEPYIHRNIRFLYNIGILKARKCFWTPPSSQVGQTDVSSFGGSYCVICSVISRFMGPTWVPPGDEGAPCWPHEPCYLIRVSIPEKYQTDEICVHKFAHFSVIPVTSLRRGVPVDVLLGLNTFRNWFQ